MSSNARFSPSPDRPLLDVDEARERILAHFSPLSPRRLPLLEALGLVLAEPIRARESVPPFTNAAMDGYAVRAADTSQASHAHPATLRVIGEAPAGGATPRWREGVIHPCLQPGTAVRIMTGAVLPPGADAVVRFEETDEAFEATPDRGRDVVRVFRPVRPGENVRPAGEDIPAGSLVLSPGTVLGPAHLGILAALGYTWVLVHPRPEVAILATGDEVVPPDRPLEPGRIRNSNSYVLAALVTQVGGIPRLIGIASDQDTDLEGRFRAARGADLVLTSGGVSQGDYDRVKEFLRTRGRFEIWQVRIKPGKPMAFGFIDDVPVLALPGNPVASVVAFLQFARPAILRLLGRADLAPIRVRAVLTQHVDNSGRRRHFVRARVERRGDRLFVTPVPNQGAGVLSGLVSGNCLAVIPEDWPEAPAGSEIEVELYDPNVLQELLA
ncbi:MAG: molybdopterin molybdotransferase MoeA [Thermomicrobium sp.]|nr:molybdopterin molybdotransferase MoeA [Thermomicrobium sp.]MDW8059969.1 molybdopterin molybdotransferase MoeA [Thermomicrobium sp.]